MLLMLINDGGSKPRKRHTKDWRRGIKRTYNCSLWFLASNLGMAMARRIELQGIANALNGSFVSRNNDFRGYWTIGQLKSFAIDSGLASMGFSLTIPKTNTTSNLQSYIVYHYTGMLKNLLRKQQLPDFWVREASITIDFDANTENAWLYECSTLGELFQCRCQIMDDIGRRYFSIIYGRCLPHSVVNELRSTRNPLV